MTKEEIIKALRDMARYPTVTLPRDSEALKVAADLLAQPEQEPVAWLNPYGGVVQKRMDGHERTHYTIPLYTTPTKRKPLTRKEVLAIIDKHPAEKKNLLPMFYRDQVLDICRDIEQAYGITGEK